MRNSFSLALLDSSLKEGAKEDIAVSLPPSMREVAAHRADGRSFAGALYFTPSGSSSAYAE